MIGKPNELARYLFTLDPNKEYEIKEHKQKRSLDANSYSWVLMQKIADKVGNTKEEVYREAIKDVGQFEILPIKDEAVDTFKHAWTKKGLGWICETLGESKLEGYTNVIAYYGTSCYTSDKMAKFIDYIVQECKQLGIETLTPDEIAQLKSLGSD